MSNILDRMFSPHLGALQNSLSLATKRESLLAANLANINVPGYKRKDIGFDITLEETMGGSDAKRGAARRSQEDEAAQFASDATSLRVDGNNVDSEKESLSIAEMQLRYEALSMATSDYFSGLKSAIREGK